ncbi:MAG: GWxTD domain-containing protein [Candidatus Aminicenantes bacterium]|nr:GWxTD domain-containing protein [Candidatus Aminicenantes bacterium]
MLIKRYGLLSILFSLLLGLISQGTSGIKDLAEPYKTWLEKDVIYIISPVEKEVFLKLGTDRERDLFMEAFWKQRDPNPHTKENEYKQEHFRRMEYVDQNFGREAPQPGWRTDRGRVHILLGKPDDIQIFETKTEIYPTEVWFYQGMEDKGLPPAFQLLFFQDKGQGEYKLYSPLSNGPQGLLSSFEEDPADHLAAYEKLKRIEPSLADASLSLIPGERPSSYTRPSLSSEYILNKIETVPLNRVQDIYARKFLEYKDTVEVEYSTNYILNVSLVKTKKDANGVNFIQYALEPERLSIENYRDKYYTSLELYGRVLDMQDRPIYQFEETIPLEFTEDQINQIKNRPFNIIHMFPIIPGKFKLSILIKNQTSKEFTSLERTVWIPGPENPVHMTSPLLSYGVKKTEDTNQLLRPFQIRDYQLYFPLNRVFTQQDTLILAYQLHGLDNRDDSFYKMRYTFLKNGELYREFTKNLSEYPEKPSVMERISLIEFPPAHYSVRVRLFKNSTEVVSSNEIFDIRSSETISRAWLYTLRLSEADDPGFLKVLGSQHVNSGHVQKALNFWEKALKINPDQPELRKKVRSLKDKKT